MNKITSKMPRIRLKNLSVFKILMLLSVLIIFSFEDVEGQDTGLRIDKNSVLGGLDGAHILLFENENDYARFRLTNSLFNSSTNNRFWDIAGRIGPNNTGLDDRLNFFLNGVGDILSLRGTGNVGIGTISPTAKLDVRGRVRIGDDQSTPLEGMIRFDQGAKTFEGYNGTTWVSLSQHCACPFVMDPFGESTSSNFEILMSGMVRITIDFSHRMSTTSFQYGTNVIVSGTGGTSAGGTLSWTNNNTRLIIETTDPWTDFVTSCFDGFDLTILGSGVSPATGENGSPLDGDRDGCCGGDYSIHFMILC